MKWQMQSIDWQSLRKQPLSELERMLQELEGPEKELSEVKTKLQKLVKAKARKEQGDTNVLLNLVPSVDVEVGLPVAPSLGKSSLPIGDVNLLMHQVPIIEPPFDRVISDLALRLVAMTSGLVPQVGVQSMRCVDVTGLRMVARWEIERPIELSELLAIHSVCCQAYQRDVVGHREQGNGWEKVVKYRDLRNHTVEKVRAIYFGTDTYYDSESTGVVVWRRFTSTAEAEFLVKTKPDEWIRGRTEQTRSIKTVVELREGPKDKQSALSQEELLRLIVQISYILAKQRLIDSRVLMTAIFRELNKVGTRAADRDKLFGMKHVLGTIERVLLLPLECPGAAARMKFNPESVLLAGVPGTGKTSLAEFLMTGVYPAIFVSVDTDRLRYDLLKSGEAGVTSMFMKIDRIRELTQLPIILLIDDIDVLVDTPEVVAKFLNVMQGIRQKGFLILASTNHPEKIDPRLLEPGRISRVVHVGLPDLEDRMGVLSNYLDDSQFEAVDERGKVISAVAKQTEGWTQRFLWELTMEAGRFCTLDNDTHLDMRHFQKALESLAFNIKDIRAWDKQIAEQVANARREIGF